MGTYTYAYEFMTKQKKKTYIINTLLSSKFLYYKNALKIEINVLYYTNKYIFILFMLATIFFFYDN